jgi:hypothetical protein
MLGWVSKRIVLSLMPHFEDYLIKMLEDENFQKYLNEYVDSLMDRQIQRIQGSIGGTMKGINAQNGEAELDFSSGNIWKSLITIFMSQKKKTDSNTSVNPFL